MKQRDGCGFSIRFICYQVWFAWGGGVRAWRLLSPEESCEPDCNMLRIHMLRLSGITCCRYARVSKMVPGGCVLRLVAISAFFFWCVTKVWRTKCFISALYVMYQPSKHSVIQLWSTAQDLQITSSNTRSSLPNLLFVNISLPISLTDWWLDQRSLIEGQLDVD